MCEINMAGFERRKKGRKIWADGRLQRKLGSFPTKRLKEDSDFPAIETRNAILFFLLYLAIEDACLVLILASMSMRDLLKGM